MYKKYCVQFVSKFKGHAHTNISRLFTHNMRQVNECEIHMQIKNELFSKLKMLQCRKSIELVPLLASYLLRPIINDFRECRHDENPLKKCRGSRQQFKFLQIEKIVQTQVYL